MTQQQTDEKFMRLALEQAMDAKAHGDYAIGAVIVKDGIVISSAGNCRREFPIDPTSHTEVVAIKRACEHLRSRYLQGCTIYSTHALCAMCLGTCIWACIDRVVYATTQADMVEHSHQKGEYAGLKTSLRWRGTEIEPEQLYPHLKLAHPTMEITSNVLREKVLRECYG